MFVKEDYARMSQCNSLTVREESAKPSQLKDNLGHSIFERSEEDDKPALSIDDKTFLAIMDAEVKHNEGNSWVAPLPFRLPRRQLPNREQALKRLQSLRKMLEKKPKMKEHYIKFMLQMIENDQAEPAPLIGKGTECWYLFTIPKNQTR